MDTAPPQTWKIQLTERKRDWEITRGNNLDRADALKVRQQIYCGELGYRWDSPEDAFDARATICVVRAPGGQPIASLRIVGPEARPFELEKYVSIDDILPALRSRPAELNRFCVLPPFRGISSTVHIAAFQFAFDIARQAHISHFVLASKPAIEPIYRFLLFEVVEGRSFFHAEMGNTLHNLMVLDLRNISERYRQVRHPFAALLPANHHGNGS